MSSESPSDNTPTSPVLSAEGIFFTWIIQASSMGSSYTKKESQAEQLTTTVLNPEEDDRDNNLEDFLYDESRAELLAKGFYSSQKSLSYLLPLRLQVLLQSQEPMAIHLVRET